MGKRPKHGASRRISGIYTITCTTPTGVHTYVGKSKHIHARCYQHSSSLRKGHHANKRLQALYDTHGILSLEMKIIELVPPPKLCAREWYWINELNPSLNIMDRKLSNQIIEDIRALRASGYKDKYICRKYCLTKGYLKYLLSLE